MADPRASGGEILGQLREALTTPLVEDYRRWYIRPYSLRKTRLDVESILRRFAKEASIKVPDALEWKDLQVLRPYV